MKTNFTPESPLLAALRQLPTGSLYGLGDKSQLMAALRLCQNEAVRPPHWERGRSVLSVDVVSGRVFEVSLSLDAAGSLQVDCECGHALSGSCAHRMATLLTLKKALAPATISGWRPDEEGLAAIRVALLDLPVIDGPSARARKNGATRSARKVDAPPADYAVEISVQYGYPIIQVVRRGIAVGSGDAHLPAELQSLLPQPYGYASAPAASLNALLDAGAMAWPVLLRDLYGQVASLTVEPPAIRRGLLSFDARADGVWVERVLDDGNALGEHLIRIGSWVIDREAQRLLRLAAPESWSLWPGLLDMASRQPEHGGYRIDWKSFSALELSVPEGETPSLEEMVFRCAGREQSPLGAPLENYRVEATMEAAGGVRLQPVAVAGDGLLPLDPRALALFTEAMLESCSTPLRAFKRRTVLYETYFAAREAKTKTERTRLLRAALKGPNFAKRKVAREARQLLERFLAFAETATWVVPFADERWRLLRRDSRREALILAILYRHFGEPALRQAQMPGEQRVGGPAFFVALPALLADLKSVGVELLFGGRAAMPASLDIHVAGGARGIDWFELRSEIRCEGALLDEAHWRQGLAQGLIEADGRLYLLDAKDREALAILAGLGGAPEKRRREVVRIPRLHILDLLALRRCGATLELAAEDAEILERLANFATLPAVAEPKLNAVLRDYQRLGYHWLAFLYRHKFGACLADDMGLGKTIQAIGLLAALRQKVVPPRAAQALPHLVVMPPSLLFNWESEIARFAPELRTLVYRGQDRCTDFAGTDVVLTSYDLIRRDIEELATIPFHVIVFDEAQAVKNVHAAATGAVRRLQGVFKLALTGTPVENHLGEYWSIIDLVLPGLLGSYRRFENRRKEVDAGELQRLIDRTRPFVLRRSKERIAAELPDKVEIDLHLELSAVQKVLYQQTVADIRAEVATAWQRQSAGQARITALAALTRLRRLCLDPRLVADAEAVPSPKIEALGEHLRELRDEGHSVLVFSQFTSFLDLVEPALTALGMPYLRLDGSTPVAARKQLVERFQNSEEPLVFLLSLKAGGRGLNLTRATYVIHLDPWWNPAVENQASDRAHRIGQTQKVTVLRLLMRHTVEEKMMALKERKKQLYRALLDEGRDGGGVPLTREDFEFLVGEGADD
ncbi:MAG: DEAD/DEAH box helicase [Desulfuromonadales bacterium]